MTRPTLSDLSPRYQTQVAAQLASVAHPRTVKIEPVEPQQKRIRQSGRAPSKLELAFAEYLAEAYPRAKIYAQAVTLKIANGCRYCPDFFVAGGPSYDVEAYEVKGPHAWDDSIVKLKVAASAYPWITFRLVSRDKRGAWRIEGVLP